MLLEALPLQIKNVMANLHDRGDWRRLPPRVRQDLDALYQAAVAAERPRYDCPLCRRTTPNPSDIEAKFCPCCGSDVLPRRCEHRL